MDELLQGLAQVRIELGVQSGTILRPFTARSARILREVWPDELLELCEHVELLKLLVLVCESHCNGEDW